MRSNPLLLAGLMLAITLAAPHPAGAATGCGTFNADGAPVHAKVIRGATTCARARAVLRRYLISNAPCSGSACVRFVRGCASRHRRIRCLPAARELQPGTTVIAAYSTAD